MSSPLKLAPTFRQRGEATRQLLLEEAERQFSDLGFHGASLNAIAAACGIGNAGALHHFASKEKLYKAVLLRLSEEFDGELQAALAERGTAQARLRKALRLHATWVIANPQRSRLILRELLDNLGRVEQARTLPMSHFVGTFCRLIEEAQKEGAAAPGPAIALLTQFLGTLAYALVVRPTFARMDAAPDLLADDARFIETIAAMAETAIVPKAPSQEHFQAKWTPVRVKKMRQNKKLELSSDSIGTEKASARRTRRQIKQEPED
jgi:TetR/AcrR family transcriptional regulator